MSSWVLKAPRMQTPELPYASFPVFLKVFFVFIFLFTLDYLAGFSLVSTGVCCLLCCRCTSPWRVYPCITQLVTAMRSPLSFLFSWLNIPSFLSLSSYVRCFRTSDHLGGLPWTDPSVSTSLALRSPSTTDAALQVWALRDHFPWPRLLLQPRMPLACVATRAQRWFVFKVMSTRIPRPFSAELLSSRGAQLTLLHRALY